MCTTNLEPSLFRHRFRVSWICLSCSSLVIRNNFEKKVRFLRFLPGSVPENLLDQFFFINLLAEPLIHVLLRVTLSVSKNYTNVARSFLGFTIIQSPNSCSSHRKGLFSLIQTVRGPTGLTTLNKQVVKCPYHSFSCNFF